MSIIVDGEVLGTLRAREVFVTGTLTSAPSAPGDLETILSEMDTAIGGAPAAHGSTHVETGSDPVPNATGAIGGLLSAVDKTKLDGIETAATADQTGAEIKVAYEGEADTNAFTDAEQTKLTGIESLAKDDQLAAEVPIADVGTRYTGTDVEAALQEIAGAGRTTETVKQNADDIAGKASITHKDDHKSGGSDAFAATDLLEAAVKRIQTSDGPTILTMGSITEGEALVRAGSTLVGSPRIAANLFLSVRNESGATIVKGKLVAVTGFDITEDLPTVVLADKDDPTKRPAIGIATADILNNTNTDVLLSVGTLEDIDTSSFSINDQLVLGDDGNLSRPPPEVDPFTGEIQLIGSVTRVHATLGQIFVTLGSGLLPTTAAQFFATKEITPTGLESGGEVTRVSGLDVAVALGLGFVNDGTDLFRVNWAADASLALTANATNFIFVDSAGVVTASTSMPSLDTNIFLADAITNGTTVILLANHNVLVQQRANKAHTYAEDVIGNVVVSGVITTKDAIAYRLEVDAGTFYTHDFKVTVPATDPVTFTYWHRDGVGGWTKTTGATLIDKDNWDDGTGTLNSLVATEWKKDLLFVVFTASGTVEYHVFYGQEVFTSQSEAEAGNVPAAASDVLSNGVRSGGIVIEGAAVAIASVVDHRPFVAQLAPGTTTVSDHGLLGGLTDDDHIQYLLTTGARAMAGNLAMGANDITGVGLVDGVDVSAHKARHVSGGADEIRTATAAQNGLASSTQISKLDGIEALAEVNPLEETLVGYQILIGSTAETVDAFITESAGTVFCNVQKEGGGDLTLIYSDGLTAFDTTPVVQIALTTGTNPAPQENWVFILKSTGLLTANTTGFPAAEHVPIGRFLVPTAALVATDGVYKNHQFNDHLFGVGNNGHVGHINAWIRNRPAGWLSGVAQTLTITPGSPDTVIFTTTSGSVQQLHSHTFPAFSGTPDLFVVNDSVTAFDKIADLNALLTDSLGGSMSGRFFSLVIWGAVNEETGESKLFVNLPGGSYNSQSGVETDTNKFTNFDIPVEFTGVGFLISELRLRHQVSGGGTWTSIEEVDLRGKFAPTAAGGVGGFSSPLTAKGDIYTHDGSEDTREPIGADGTIPVASAAAANGWDWNTPTAATIDIADAGSRYTGTEVEAALQEIAGAGRTTESVKGNADAIAGVSTAHSDITNAGSGAIITTGERTNLSTTDQKAALAGTGTPASGDRYVNESDGRVIRRALQLHISGDAVVQTYPLTAMIPDWLKSQTGSITLVDVRGISDTAPTVSTLRIDVLKNGSSVFASDAAKINIAAGTTADDSGTITTTTAAKNDEYQLEVETIGTVPGADITVKLEFDVVVT